MKIPQQYQDAQDQNQDMVIGLYSRYAQFSIGYRLKDGIHKKPTLNEVLVQEDDSGGLIIAGIEYPTIEQAWLADKFLSRIVKQRIAIQESPGRGRRIAAAYTPDNESFDPILSLFTIYKQHLTSNFFLLQQLKQTGNKPIVHLNWWGDLLLGAKLSEDNEVIGANNLGKILEVLREEL